MDKDRVAALWGLGSYTPAKKLTNRDFEQTLDTSDDWITSRTGIKCRRIAAPDEVTSDLCHKAAQSALEQAGLRPADLDLLIVATLTPDHPMPSTACVLQQKLGLGAQSTPAFDLNAACSGFIYGLAMAKAYVESGAAQHVLVVGAEILSRVLDYQDRATCILFGDAAGAAVIGLHRKSGPSHKLLSVRLFSDGRGAQMLTLPAGGSAKPASHATVDERLHYVKVSGREVFRFGVSKSVEMLQGILDAHGLKAGDIGKIVPHQANIRILESACERLGLSMNQIVTNLAEYGNTSSASIPLALDEAARKQQLPAGKPVVLLAFGAGLTWASAVFEW